MTRRQLNLAAKLYSLAMVAHIDAGGADSDDEAKVMGNAAKRANTALRRLGVDRGDIITFNYRKRMTPRLDYCAVIAPADRCVVSTWVQYNTFTPFIDRKAYARPVHRALCCA